MTNRSLQQITLSFGVASFFTGVSYILAVWLNWITELNWLEVFAVWTSYSCTYLFVKQVRFCYIIGIISTVALCWLFYQTNLLGSAAQNAYMCLTLIYGYYIWGPDAQTRPVTQVELKNLPVYMTVTLMLYCLIDLTIKQFGGSVSRWDAGILIGSILAQFLLDRKKIDNWAVWCGVNIIAIYVYLDMGLYLIAFQFMIFLLNSFYGWYEWMRTTREQRDLSYA